MTVALPAVVSPVAEFQPALVTDDVATARRLPEECGAEAVDRPSRTPTGETGYRVVGRTGPYRGGGAGSVNDPTRLSG